jgi:hypothetical protein
MPISARTVLKTWWKLIHICWHRPRNSRRLSYHIAIAAGALRIIAAGARFISLAVSTVDHPLGSPPLMISTSKADALSAPPYLEQHAIFTCWARIIPMDGWLTGKSIYRVSQTYMHNLWRATTTVRRLLPKTVIVYSVGRLRSQTQVKEWSMRCI